MVKKKTSKSKGKGKRGRDACDTTLYCRTQTEAAAYLGVTTKTIRRYKNQRLMPVTAQGWYIKEKLKLWHKDDKGDGGMTVHRQRDTIAQAGIREARQKLIELELAERRGLFHDTIECEKRQMRKQVVVLREVAVMRKKILAQLATKDRAAANRIIKDAVRNMRIAVLGSD